MKWLARVIDIVPSFFILVFINEKMSVVPRKESEKDENRPCRPRSTPVGCGRCAIDSHLVKNDLIYRLAIRNLLMLDIDVDDIDNVNFFIDEL